jgi:penicillin-binding protein 2
VTPTADAQPASQGQYPLSSVFKSSPWQRVGRATLHTETYQCGYFFANFRRPPEDWTYEYFQKDGRTIPSGLLTLPEGLMRSCNPYFWHIGLDLFNLGETKDVSEMARGFGWAPTGVVGLEENPGRSPTRPTR